MTYLRAVAFLLLTAATPLAPAFQLNPLDAKARVAELNGHALKLVGVSLNALRHLADASSTSYVPLWHLERSGGMEYVRELEQAGYVRVEQTQGLPDGTQKAETFVRLIPVGTGAELARVLSLPHDGALRPTR